MIAFRFRGKKFKIPHAQLDAAGLSFITLWKGESGIIPLDQRLLRQTSKVFDTWQLAVQAVLDGFRPNPMDEAGNSLPSLPDVVDSFHSSG